MHIPKWDSGPYLKTPVLSLLHFLFTPQVSHVSLKLPERLFSAPPSGCFCLTLFPALSSWLQNPKGQLGRGKAHAWGPRAVFSGDGTGLSWDRMFWLLVLPYKKWGLPRWCSGKEHIHQCRRLKRSGHDPWVRKISWRRKWQPAPEFLPGKFHGQRNLVGYTVHGLQWVWLRDWAHMQHTYHQNENHLALISVEITVGTSWVVQWLGLHLLVQGVWVQSLVRELGSHMPWGQKKTSNKSIKQKQYGKEFDKDFEENGLPLWLSW